MNICESFSGSRPRIFKSFSTNNINSKSLDYIGEGKQIHGESGFNQEHLMSRKRASSFRSRKRYATISGVESNAEQMSKLLHYTKSFNLSKKHDKLPPLDEKKISDNYELQNDDIEKKACGSDEKRPGVEAIAWNTLPTNAFTRLRENLKNRNSKELSRRDSQILVARFEVELAITKNDRDKLRTFINSKTLDLNAKDYYGKTLLHTACSEGNYRCAQILINAGAQVDTQDQSGFTPLHCAVVENSLPCAAVLIAAGADVLASTRNLHTPLTLAYGDEMILLVGRSLALSSNTLPQRKTPEIRTTSL